MIICDNVITGDFMFPFGPRETPRHHLVNLARRGQRGTSRGLSGGARTPGNLARLGHLGIRPPGGSPSYGQ